MPRESRKSILDISEEKGNESLQNLLENIQETVGGASREDIESLNREKLREWVEIDQSLENLAEEFVDYRKRAESDPEAATQIAELKKEQEEMQNRAEELLAEFVAELKKLRESEPVREGVTAVESGSEKEKLMTEAEEIVGEAKKLVEELDKALENKTATSDSNGAISSAIEKINTKNAGLTRRVNLLNSDAKVSFAPKQVEIASLIVNINILVRRLKAKNKSFTHDPEDTVEVEEGNIERTELVGDDEAVHAGEAESSVIELRAGLDKTTATTINEALKSINDIAVRKEAKKILSDAFRGLDKEKNWQMFSILELFSYQRELPEQIVAMKSTYGEEKLVEKLKIMVDRASHMLRMIESDPEKAELAGRTTVEMAEKLHKWCDERGLKGTFFADDEEKYKTSMYWDIAKYDGAVHGGLAITDANPGKKVYKSIADLKKAQFVKEGSMDVGHPDRLTEDELKEIAARCYFDASPLDKNTEAKLRQELSVARMKMWFEEEHEKEEYKEEHDGSLDGFEYSFAKKLREADELAEAEKEGVAILVKALDAANREKKEVSLEAPLVPGAIKRIRTELRKNATDTNREKSEHAMVLLRVLETWVKKQYAKDQRELEFAELQRRWDGAGVEDWILEVKAAEEKKARAKFDGIKKRIFEAEQRAKKYGADAASLQSIIDMAHGGSLTRDQYSKAIASLSKEMKQDQWRGSPEFRSSGKDETERLVDFAKRVVLEVERAVKVEEDRAKELKGELTEFQSYDWAHEKAGKAAAGGHPEKDGAHPVTDKAGHHAEAGGHDDHAVSKKHPAIEKLDSAGHDHGHGHEKEEKKLPEFKTIPYEEIPGKPETGSDSPEVFFDGWEYGYRKSLDLLKFWDRLHKKSLDWFESRDTVQSEYDTMPEEQKIRLANTLSAVRAEDTTSAAFYETSDPYFKKGYKGEGTKRKGKEDKPKEELLEGVLEPRPFGLKRQDLEKIFAQQAKPGANGEQQKGVFWTQIPSTNVPKHEGERQLFLISLHTTDNKLGKGKPVKFYLDVKREVAERVNALLTHDADNAIHIVRGLAKVYGYERFVDVPFHHGQTMHAEVPWSGEKKKLEIAPPLPDRPKAGPPVDHGRRNVLAAAVLAGGAYFVGKSEIPRVARMWRKKKPRSEEENYEIKESYGELPALPVDDEISLALRNVSDSDRRNLGVSSNEEFWSEPMKKQRDAGKRGALKPGVVSEFGKNRDEIVSAVKRESEKYGVPERVMYGIIGLESGGKNVAVSELGAAGLYQFIPSTGRAYGLVEYHYTDEQGNIINPKDKEKHKGKKLKRVDTADHRDNIEKSTVAAAKYLRDLYKQYGDWNLVYGAYFLGGPFDKLINAYLKKVRPGENLAVRSLPAGKKLSDYGVSVLTLGYYMHSTGMRDLDIPIIYAENGKPADRKKMLTQQLVPYVYKAEGLSVRIPKEYKINVSETKSSVNEEFSDVDESMLEVDRAPQVPDEEISVSGTSTNTPDVKNLQSTDTSTQTDAVLSRRDLLRGKKPEKAAEAPKGLSADGRWAKNLVSELDKFSDEKMNRSEKDKLIQAILSAEERTNNIARSTAPLSKEDYDAIIAVTKKVIEKMQWADGKLGIDYIQSRHVETMNKKLKSFEEKRKRVR